MIVESTEIHATLLFNERGGLGLFQIDRDFARATLAGPVTVPAGYVTDFASIPRIARWLFPQCGRSSVAALVHDWMMARGDKAMRRQAVRVFGDELKKAGSGAFRRWAMVAFVFVATFPSVYLLKMEEG